MTKYCHFTNVDNEIKSHIIQTCTSTRLRRKALTEPHLTLNQLIDTGCTIVWMSRSFLMSLFVSF